MVNEIEPSDGRTNRMITRRTKEQTGELQYSAPFLPFGKLERKLESDAFRAKNIAPIL